MGAADDPQRFRGAGVLEQDQARRRRTGKRRPDDAKLLKAVADAKKAAKKNRRQSRPTKRRSTKLLPFQRGDFEGIFEAMDGLPVIIRLIDPPLHEFLPSFEALLEEVTDLKARIDVLSRSRAIAQEGREVRQADAGRAGRKEVMLKAVNVDARSQPDAGSARHPPGHHLSRPSPRCRCAPSLRRPALQAKKGIVVKPEVMIPLTGHVNELQDQRRPTLEAVAKQVMEEQGVQIEYKFGTMIEVPRGALTAGEIAELRAVLLVRHQRPDADDVRLQPRRRRGQVPAALRRRQDPAREPVPGARPRRRGPADQDGRDRRPQDPARSGDRHLRRARRRSVVHRVLPPDRAELCVLQPVPRAGGPPGGGAGRARHHHARQVVWCAKTRRVCTDPSGLKANDGRRSVGRTHSV